MKRHGAKRFVCGLLSVLLCVPVSLGVLSACTDKEDDTTVIKQSTEKDTAAVSFTALNEVKVTDGYAENGMEKEVAYLLKLDENKLLYYFHINAGLTPLATASYKGGWEGALIGGHTLGHYLTALAQAYKNANTSTESQSALLAKMQKIAGELLSCQENAVKVGAKEGFIWGAPAASANLGNKEAQFDFVEQNRANIATEAWVPWYTMHKILQGLIDVANLTGGEVSETAKEVATSLGNWVYNRVSKWTAAVQKTVLGIEYGGMNDCLYNLYLLTGEDKYVEAAHKFDEETLFGKILDANANYLDGQHANTTIPKILGALNRYVACHGKTINGDTVDASEYLEIAETFWQYVIDHHTYVTGGNSEWEHFGKDDVLNAERTNCNCETCNTYNMLKMSRTLFTITGNKKYLDYYENTYYNAILSSQNPETGMTTYFQPMATGYFKVYSTEESNFWCCTGSGMESFSKLGDSIYYDGGNSTYVSLYLSSEYVSDKVSLTMAADLENSDEVTINVGSGSTVLRLRPPYWTESFTVTVNGKEVETAGDEAFVSVAVKKGDEVKVTVKKTVKAYNLPDGKNTYAFLYGPFVLSAELGTENMNVTRTVGVAVTVPGNVNGTTTESGHDKNAGSTYTVNVNSGTVDSFISNINANLKKGENGKFTLNGIEPSLTYLVHYRQHGQRYGIYMTFKADEAAVETAEPWVWDTQDTVQPGYGQYENDALHNIQESNTTGATNVAGLGTTRKANAGGSFTYRMKVDKTAENRLTVSFAKADNGKTILIKTGATTLYSKTLSYLGAADSYDVNIAIPKAVADAAEEISYTDAGGNSVKAVIIPITFSGVGGAESARVCSFIYTQKRTFNEKAQDSKVAYFVDCGDYDVYTLSEGDKLGKNQSVTEQIYGTDAVTGKKWGLVDNHATNIAGVAPGGVYTNSTWAFEQQGISDGAGKIESNRYTKNQFENGVARNLHYKFELANGTYTVKMYFVDPWSCSKNPNVSANGTSVISNGEIGKELSFTVTVTDGELTLDITTTDKCINLCYIQILFA